MSVFSRCDNYFQQKKKGEIVYALGIPKHLKKVWLDLNQLSKLRDDELVNAIAALHADVTMLNFRCTGLEGLPYDKLIRLIEAPDPYFGNRVAS